MNTNTTSSTKCKQGSHVSHHCTIPWWHKYASVIFVVSTFDNHFNHKRLIVTLEIAWFWTRKYFRIGYSGIYKSCLSYTLWDTTLHLRPPERLSCFTELLRDSNSLMHVCTASLRRVKWHTMLQQCYNDVTLFFGCYCKTCLSRCTCVLLYHGQVKHDKAYSKATEILNIHWSH